MVVIQVQVCALSGSCVQRSPTECGVSECGVSECGVSECGVSECGVPECDREALRMRSPWPTRGCCSMKTNSKILFSLTVLLLIWVPFFISR